MRIVIGFIYTLAAAAVVCLAVSCANRVQRFHSAERAAIEAVAQ